MPSASGPVQQFSPNPFSHPFVRYVRRGEVLIPVESAVYNVETGGRVLCWPVDAKEMVATGGWSFDPVEPKRAAIADKAEEALPSEPIDADSPATESAPASTFKRGPGRPRKAAS